MLRFHTSKKVSARISKKTVNLASGPISIMGCIINDHFVVHRPVDQRQAGYDLSHLETGRRVCSADDVKTLLALAEKLAAIGDWSFKTIDGISPELSRKASEILGSRAFKSVGSVSVSVSIKVD